MNQSDIRMGFPAALNCLPLETRKAHVTPQRERDEYKAGVAWFNDWREMRKINGAAQAPRSESVREWLDETPQVDADGWVTWGGGECPIKDGELVEARFKDGDEDSGEGPEEWWPRCWMHEGSEDDWIIAYRIVKDQA